MDGKTVDLFSDHTWKFRGPAAGCDTIWSGINFCDPNGDWERQSTVTGDAAAQFRHDDRHYGLFIIEDLGSNDGVSFELMRSAAIERFAGFTGSTKEDVLIFEVKDGSFGSIPSSFIAYGGDLDGLDVVFANTIVLEASRTTQIATYSIGREFSAKHRELHEKFVAAVKFD